jgi:DNA adenine methylase/adenine-specific DNA-methyltransferase
MLDTKTRKLPKPVTGYSNKGTIVEAFRGTFQRLRNCGTIVLSYGSNALPDKETITSLLLAVKRNVEVRAIPHTYHYGTHRAATRRTGDEYIFIAR